MNKHVRKIVTLLSQNNGWDGRQFQVPPSKHGKNILSKKYGVLPGGCQTKLLLYLGGVDASNRVRVRRPTGVLRAAKKPLQHLGALAAVRVRVRRPTVSPPAAIKLAPYLGALDVGLSAVKGYLGGVAIVPSPGGR